MFKQAGNKGGKNLPEAALTHLVVPGKMRDAVTSDLQPKFRHTQH